jgi:hypothetical protein
MTGTKNFEGIAEARADAIAVKDRRCGPDASTTGTEARNGMESPSPPSRVA